MDPLIYSLSKPMKKSEIYKEIDEINKLFKDVKKEEKINLWKLSLSKNKTLDGLTDNERKKIINAITYINRNIVDIDNNIISRKFFKLYRDFDRIIYIIKKFKKIFHSFHLLDIIYIGYNIHGKHKFKFVYKTIDDDTTPISNCIL